MKEELKNKSEMSKEEFDDIHDDLKNVQAERLEATRQNEFLQNKIKSLQTKLQNLKNAEEEKQLLRGSSVTVPIHQPSGVQNQENNVAVAAPKRKASTGEDDDRRIKIRSEEKELDRDSGPEKSSELGVPKPNLMEIEGDEKEADLRHGPLLDNEGSAKGVDVNPPSQEKELDIDSGPEKSTESEVPKPISMEIEGEEEEVDVRHGPPLDNEGSVKGLAVNPPSQNLHSEITALGETAEVVNYRAEDVTDILFQGEDLLQVRKPLHVRLSP